MALLLYNVIPGPLGDCGTNGQLCVDDRAMGSRWAKSRQVAESAAQYLCERIGPRPQPGIQNTKPIPVIVVEVEYAEAVDVANGKRARQREVFRVWSLADGSWTNTEPS